jgi:hypothetical protein
MKFPISEIRLIIFIVLCGAFFLGTTGISYFSKRILYENPLDFLEPLLGYNRGNCINIHKVRSCNLVDPKGHEKVVFKKEKEFYSYRIGLNEHLIEKSAYKFKDESKNHERAWKMRHDKKTGSFVKQELKLNYPIDKTKPEVVCFPRN